MIDSDHATPPFVLKITLHWRGQKPQSERKDENKSEKRKESSDAGRKAKYGGDFEAAAAARSSAIARAATLGDSVACEAEVRTLNAWENGERGYMMCRRVLFLPYSISCGLYGAIGVLW